MNDAGTAVWKLGSRTETFSRPFLLGVLNVTPDSFYDGGRFGSVEAAVEEARRMRDDGADMIDVGGESTRPGAEEIAPEIQMARVLPVIRALSADGVAVSIDTRSAVVAKEALAAGAIVVNDVSGGADPAMVETVRDAEAGYVLMHSRGTPKTMQIAPEYDNVIREVSAWFDRRLALWNAAGVDRDRIVLDVGIGFGKRVEDNLELIGRIDSFHRFGRPLLLGASRKSFLGGIGAGAAPVDRLAGSIAAAVCAWRRGVRIFRVHDVGQTRQALAAAAAIEEAETEGARC